VSSGRRAPGVTHGGRVAEPVVSEGACPVFILDGGKWTGAGVVDQEKGGWPGRKALGLMFGLVIVGLAWAGPGWGFIGRQGVLRVPL